MFDSDLKISFEENPKEMQYCNGKLNVLSDMFDHQVAVKQLKVNTLSESNEFKPVYRQLNFEYDFLSHYQVMGKVHASIDTSSYIRVLQYYENAHAISSDFSQV